jgi:hypothetical protein
MDTLNQLHRMFIYELRMSSELERVRSDSSYSVISPGMGLRDELRSAGARLENIRKFVSLITDTQQKAIRILIYSDFVSYMVYNPYSSML